MVHRHLKHPPTPTCTTQVPGLSVNLDHTTTNTPSFEWKETTPPSRQGTSTLTNQTGRRNPLFLLLSVVSPPRRLVVRLPLRRPGRSVPPRPGLRRRPPLTGGGGVRVRPSHDPSNQDDERQCSSRDDWTEDLLRRTSTYPSTSAANLTTCSRTGSWAGRTGSCRDKTS